MNLPFVVRGVDYEFQLSNKFKLSSGFLETLALVYVMWRWVLGLEEITQSLADILEALGEVLQELLVRLRKAI